MLNKAILMGRLTRDPEIRSTQTGVSVCTFTLAVDRNYAKPGEQKKTDFINIVAWRGTADFVARYFRKGQLVAVSGSIQTRTWEDQSGNRRYATEVVAEDVYFAEGRRDDSPEVPDVMESDEVAGFSPMSGDDDLPF